MLLSNFRNPGAYKPTPETATVQRGERFGIMLAEFPRGTNFCGLFGECSIQMFCLIPKELRNDLMEMARKLAKEHRALFTSDPNLRKRAGEFLTALLPPKPRRRGRLGLRMSRLPFGCLGNIDASTQKNDQPSFGRGYISKPSRTMPE
jgi:hypothetical protein